MPKLDIKLYGTKTLKEKAEIIKKEEFGSKELKEKIGNLIDVMIHCNGVGISSNQVGLKDSIIAYDLENFQGENKPKENFEECFLVLVNPKIISSKGKQRREEGCLSFPKVFLTIDRPQIIVVQYQDYITGKVLEMEGKDFFASALCHEIDHLNGILFIDHISKTERSLIKKRLSSIKSAQKILECIENDTMEELGEYNEMSGLNVN